jgi:hypothetical protein
LILACAGSAAAWAAEPPAWTPAVYIDYPVEIELADRAALDELLAAVTPASFDRDQISPRPGGGWIFQPRVTEQEAAALATAGYRFKRVPDREKEGRRAVEAAWALRDGKSEAPLPAAPLTDYPTHAEIGVLLAALETTYPAICDTFVWGTSVQGRELWGIRISDNVGVTEAEPEVRLSSSMHGNEVVGMVLLLNLADHLATHYGQQGYEDVTALVEGTEIHIMPLHNPDGYAGGTRANASGIDLNRNYPEPNPIHATREVETVHFMNYAAAHDFVISQNGHGGALVVNYPWDWTFDLSPDDAAIQLLSLEYSTTNLPMYNGNWSEGIVNGAVWYVANGTLQDWSYDQTGCIDLTVELGNAKWPPAADLDDYWDDNRQSLLSFTAAARYGVNGIVTDAVSGLPLDATVTVTGNTQPVTTDPEHGDYYKLLPTGTFELTFSATGYTTLVVPGVATVWGAPTVLDVALPPDTSSVPQAPALALRAWPNPFNPGTTFFIEASRAGRARLEIFDLRGRRIRRLWDAPVGEGMTPVTWDGRTDAGRGVEAGAYLGRVTVADRTSTVKVMLVR